MTFFFNEAKASPAPARKAGRSKRDIPIQTLERMGCGGCPKNDDRDLYNPKMAPTGAKSPLVYVLGSAPTREEDDRGAWMTSEVNRYILKKFPRGFDRSLRFGGVTQCGTDSVSLDPIATACCRSRVVADIEASKPLVILGIGDAPLAWATGLDAYAPKFRGRLIPVKVGRHICFYYPVMFPNWFFKKNQFGKNPNELAFEHDLARLVDLVERERLPQNHYFTGDPFEGVKIITGNEAGDFQKLERALADMASLPRVGVDIETNGLRPLKIRDPSIWMSAVGTFERTVAFPIDHPEGWGSEHQQRRVSSLYAEFLLHSGIKECHNLAMELEWFGHRYGTRLIFSTEWDDTMSMAHTVDERPGTKSLEVQGILTHGINIKALSNIDSKRIVEYPLVKALTYNGLDGKWTNKLSRYYRPLIEASPAMRWEHARKVRLASTLVKTELIGMPVDMNYALRMEEDLDAQVSKIEARIARCPEIKSYEQKFGRFSPSNSNDVLKLLDKICQRDEIHVETRDGTSKSTGEEVLSSIPAKEVPSAPLVLEYRGIEKLLSTYIRPVTTKGIISTDKRIHAKYSSMTAVTTRLAAEDPNMQNWPKRKHVAVRGIVAAEPGHIIMAADFGQIEFRVAGMASEDQNLVKYCWTGYDVHKFWAQRMLKEDRDLFDGTIERFELKEKLKTAQTKDPNANMEDLVLKTVRQEAKNGFVFPMIFGSSVKSCSAQLLIPLDVMESLAEEFWDEFNGVKKWQERLLKNYEKNLYVETLSGARRRGAMTKNEIINHPIQGTAAHIVGEAMMAINERAELTEDEDLTAILNVHDDLTAHPREQELPRIVDIYAMEMCRHRFNYINVPLMVEISTGKRWNELKEIGKFRSDELYSLRNPFAKKAA